MTGLRLRNYQAFAVTKLWDNPRFALFLDMGLGKTAIVLAALEDRHLPALIVSTKRVTEITWPEEIAKWRPDLTFAVAAGSKKNIEDALSGDIRDITLLSRDNIHRDFDHSKFKTVVLDELSSFKTVRSRRTQAAKRVTESAEYVWGLTGTPAAQRLNDLWSQMYLIDRGKSLGRTKTAFNEHFFFAEKSRYSKGFEYRTLRPGAEEEMADRLAPISLTMRSADYLDLPEYTEHIVPVELSKKTMKVYRDMKKKYVAEGVTAANAGVKAAKLQQITSGFMYHHRTGDIVHLHDEKIGVVEELVSSAQSPVLLFYRFKAEADMLKRKYPKAQFGLSSPKIQEAWNSGDIPLLVVQPESASHGLNLQHGGHTAIWTTPIYSNEVTQQANKRLHRSGQRNPVVTHYILARGTIDYPAYARLGEKSATEDRLLDYLKGQD